MTSTMEASDVTAIEKNITGLAGIAPVYSGRMQAIAGSANSNVTVHGITPDYRTVRDVSVQYGSFITEKNVTNIEKVAVIGTDVVENLFAGVQNPIGREIRISNSIFTVIGILESSGEQNGMSSADNVILIPLTTMQQRLVGEKKVTGIYVSVENADSMERIQNEITVVLLNAHKITDIEDQDFSVLNQADAVETLEDVTATFTYLLGGIAAISLLVGGIGVMNIMLVSVTERTREIGIRKAIGAKKRDIMLQFLVESTVLSLLGGILGILASMTGALIVTKYVGFSVTVALSPILLAFIFSISIGIFFGMLPAYKAAKLRPIEALRYE